MYPKEFCRKSGKRKAFPKKAKPKINNIMFANPKFRFFRILRSSIGCFTVSSVVMNIIKLTNEIAKQVRIKFEVHPPVFHAALPSERANSRNTKNNVIEMKPSKSNERALSVLYSAAVL